MNAELLTIGILGLIVVSAILKMPAGDAKEIALALGGALGGYLTKSIVDMAKNAIQSLPGKPEIKED